VDEANYAAEFLTANTALAANGYDHYEVSNASLPGHRAKHNSAYWRRASFIGLGPSAHSGFGRERRWNVREWAEYERIVARGDSPRAGRELLDDDAIRLEELYLGLRTREGLPVSRLPASRLDTWIEAGWATTQNGRVHLTPEGWLRLDALVGSV
jgi:oxygen-independent coproporphyrinogen-3 oxidase